MHSFIKVMKKDILLKKALNYYKSFGNSNKCEDLISRWVDAVVSFDSQSKEDSCSEDFIRMQFFVLTEFLDKDYLAKKDALFGDLFEIRTKGFENRYLANIKLCATYKRAYEKTELEYIKTFSKRRYSSYDSFRQIRSRKLKQRGLDII